MYQAASSANFSFLPRSLALSGTVTILSTYHQIIALSEWILF
jgi:hypothetical protein